MDDGSKIGDPSAEGGKLSMADSMILVLDGQEQRNLVASLAS